MKKNKKAAMFLSLGVMAMMVWGCGAKKIETTEVPKEPEANEPVAKVEPTTQPEQQKYVVKAGDTLWAISHQSSVYSDSFEWPLIFKTDRDQIKDPDQIEIGQVLMIQKGQTDDQVKHAISLASDTPKFVSHEAPRSPLPVNYF